MGLLLHFHPDLPFEGGSVVESLARDGVYRSQFSTGTSNGGLTAVPGGARSRWESRLFGGRYDSGPAAERPVYGAWQRRADPYGAAIRFGSAYLRLTEDCEARASYCYPDSAFEPTDVGGPELRSHLCDLADAALAQGVDDPDDYVEAHVHGPVLLPRDVVEVVLDPCFRRTPVEAAARALAPRVSWHPGYRVRTADLDADYRGAEPLALARRLGAVLTPDVLGAAARSGEHDPQVLKKVWHLLARWGRVSGP